MIIHLFCLHSDEEELRKSFSELGDSLCETSASRPGKGEGSGGGGGGGGSGSGSGGGGKPLTDETQHPSGSLLYKNGFLVRKVHADPDGKRSTKTQKQKVNAEMRQQSQSAC